ncbi:hypothetical protein QFC24_006766 [Naganishia onofrii]|uniref:Uncharacterized protein n=1 Tax=Naganishia onofrii TaxID=1851511 RepID=A0ACC2WYN6_9TREE|nr:hypothetical protein QFC24_006766 [Naganishia onofrii]
MPNIIKASVVQCSTVKYDLDATLDKMDLLVKLARERDVGERDPTGRDDYLAYVKSAVTIPGPAISRVEEIAKEHDVMIVSGAIEKVGGTLYCSVIWVHPEHGLVGKRRKDHVPASKDAHLESKSNEDGEGIKIAGGSVIIDPMGKVLAGPLRGSEG